jgi:chromate reductase
MSETESDRPAKVRVVGISGSLRKASFNTALLRAAMRLAPAGVELEAISIAEIPSYNEDVREGGYPPVVLALRAAIARADAVLLVTPEYNYSIPGVLKNALDWVSRPPDPAMADKPVAIMSASPGALGGARAQYHLRQICVYLDAHVLNGPEIFVAHADKKFDAQGKLIDEKTGDIVQRQLLALRDWTLRLGSKRGGAR